MPGKLVHSPVLGAVDNSLFAAFAVATAAAGELREAAGAPRYGRPDPVVRHC
jgi:hypothetical protein